MEQEDTQKKKKQDKQTQFTNLPVGLARRGNEVAVTVNKVVNLVECQPPVGRAEDGHGNECGIRGLAAVTNSRLLLLLLLLLLLWWWWWWLLLLWLLWVVWLLFVEHECLVCVSQRKKMRGGKKKTGAGNDAKTTTKLCVSSTAQHAAQRPRENQLQNKICDA